MLTATKVKQASYYLDGGSGCGAASATAATAATAKGMSTYYFGEGEAVGVWDWRGHDGLGQTGEIHPEGASGAAFVSVVDHLQHPVTGESLGRAPQVFTDVEARVAKWKRRHPLATEEDAEAYRLKIAAEATQSAATAHDLCYSPVKSLSVWHAALERAGRHEEAAKIIAAHEAGVDAAMTHVYNSLAFHQHRPSGPKENGRRTSYYTRTANLQMAKFQHTISRDQDPQIHTHVVVVARAQDEHETWRALYSPAIYKAKHEADAIYSRTVESRIMWDLGAQWEWRPDGIAREVVGVPAAARDEFSTRTRKLTERAEELVDTFHKLYGRAPSGRERWSLQQQATLDTRARKRTGKARRETDLARWAQSLASHTDATLEEVAASVDEHRLDTIVVPSYDPDRIIGQALAEIEKKHGVWNRSLLTDAINDKLPAMLVTQPEEIPALLDWLTDRALASDEVVRTDPGPVVSVPANLRDAKTGESRFASPDGRTYTTLRHLAKENSLVARLDVTGAPKVTPAAAAALVADSGLTGEQATLVAGVLSSGYRTEIIDARAGTGKTTAMRFLSAATQEQWGVPVVGFAVAENAAQVLRNQGLTQAHNVAAYLDFRDRERRGEVSDAERATFDIRPGAYVVVDEASTIDTSQLVALAEEVEGLAGKLILLGDRQQADPVDAGGAFAMLIDEVHRREREEQPKALPAGQGGLQDAAMAAWTGSRVRELREVHRYDAAWEREASRRLGDRDVTAVADYDRHARIHGHTDPERNRDWAVRNWLTDYLPGKQSMLITESVDDATAVGWQARTKLVEHGIVEPDGVPLRDDNLAGVGDLIQSRENDKQIDTYNRQRWEVVGRDDAGNLTVREQLAVADGVQQWGEPRQLPADYVQTQVELAYSGTVLAVQGMTLKGSGHMLVPRYTGFSHAYVGGGRATEANHWYLDLEEGETPAGRLAAIISKDDHVPAARTEIEAEDDRSRSLGNLGPQWERMVRETRAMTHREILARELGDEAPLVLEDGASARLYGLLRGAETRGYDAHDLVHAAMRHGKLSKTREPAAALYARVNREIDGREPTGTIPVGFEARVPHIERGNDQNGHLQFARETGRVMDRRVAELGQRVADEQPEWAVRAFGPPPQDPVELDAWKGRAALPAAYRERYGITDQRSPLGERPAHADPERSWFWDLSARQMGMPDDQRDLAALPSGELHNRIETWDRELAALPRYVGDDLRAAHEARDYARHELATAPDADQRLAVEADVQAMDDRIKALETLSADRAAKLEQLADVKQQADAANVEWNRRVEREEAERGEQPGPPREQPVARPQPVSRDPVPSGPQVDPDEVVLARWADRHVDGPVPLFGSRAYVDLAPDDPRRQAAITEAAVRGWNFGARHDRDDLYRREAAAQRRIDEAWQPTRRQPQTVPAGRDMTDAEEIRRAHEADLDAQPDRVSPRVLEAERNAPADYDYIGPMTEDEAWRAAEPERVAYAEPTDDFDVISQVLGEAQPHLQIEATPEYPSAAWAMLPEDAPEKEAAEYRSALDWWNGGRDLDRVALEVDAAEERAAALDVREAQQDAQRQAHQEAMRERAEADRAEAQRVARWELDHERGRVPEDPAFYDPVQAALTDFHAPDTSDSARQVADHFLTQMGVDQAQRDEWAAAGVTEEQARELAATGPVDETAPEMREDHPEPEVASNLGDEPAAPKDEPVSLPESEPVEVDESEPSASPALEEPRAPEPDHEGEASEPDPDEPGEQEVHEPKATEEEEEFVEESEADAAAPELEPDEPRPELVPVPDEPDPDPEPEPEVEPAPEPEPPEPEPEPEPEPPAPAPEPEPEPEPPEPEPEPEYEPAPDIVEPEPDPPAPEPKPDPPEPKPDPPAPEPEPDPEPEPPAPEPPAPEPELD